MEKDYPITSPTQRYHSLDGLRAIAILLVLLWHFTPGRNSDQGMGSIVFKLADIGWAGVDLFFVLSGFLITDILLKAKLSQEPIANFFARRLLRIVPLYYLALLLVFIVLPMVSNLYSIPRLKLQYPYWLYLSNFESSAPRSWLSIVDTSHFWSLAVEMQFYLLWPCLIYRCTAKTAVQIGFISIMVASLGRGFATYFGAPWTVPFQWTPFRIDGLIIGSVAAIAMNSGTSFKPRDGALLLVAAIGGGFAAWAAWTHNATAMFKEGSYPLHIATKTVLPTLLSLLFGVVLWFSLRPNRLSRFLGRRAFKSMALYSYGIYVWHYILMPWMERTMGPKVLNEWIGGQDLPIYVYFLLASTVSFLVAAVSFHLFEIHFLRLKSRFSATKTAIV